MGYIAGRTGCCDLRAALCFLDAEPPFVPGNIVAATAASRVANVGNRIIARCVPACGPACRRSSGGRSEARHLKCAIAFAVGPGGAAMGVVVESEVDDNKT